MSFRELTKEEILAALPLADGDPTERAWVHSEAEAGGRPASPDYVEYMEFEFEDGAMEFHDGTYLEVGEDRIARALHYLKEAAVLADLARLILERGAGK